MPANPAAVNAARHGSVIWETSAPLNTPSERHTHELSLWRRIAVWPLAMLARLWAMSLRVEFRPEEYAMVRSMEGPVVFVLWHNRLFMAADMHRRTRPNRHLYGLISASRDGAWLSAFFDACGVSSVRGSSSRMAREAVRELVEVVRAGNDAGITPDGPRGPMYEVKPGALIVARRAGAAVVMLGLDYASSRRLRSWDGLHLPLPFSRAYARLQRVDLEAQDDREEGARALREALAAINPDRRPAPVRTTG